ncbi:hypothetical protein LIER_22107 [Lithospermum erythrorhizon]|uniref:Uncharacterized protein n=1 Tax=Lithospermum erythrorhizon TaxID=34254 RepID=A0AAV3QVN3_LITER
MDAEILRDLMKCSLTEEERTPMVLNKEDLAKGVVECEASIYVKIHALGLGFVSIQGFSVAMARAWKVELRKDREGKKFFRVKATIKVNQPVRRLVNFMVGGIRGARYLAYEQLPHLYFHCGLLGHLIRHFLALPEGAKPQKHVVYGLWIKAPMEKSWVAFKSRNGEEPLPTLSIDWGEGVGNHWVEEDGGEGDVAPTIPPGF